MLGLRSEKPFIFFHETVCMTSGKSLQPMDADLAERQHKNIIVADDELSESDI